MKEIPLLFSTPMVSAILDKRKTQTRRIVKPQIKDCDHSRYTEADWKDKPTEWSEAALKIGRAYCGMCGNGVEYSKDYGGIKCPYGVLGDLLYAREEHYRYGHWVEKEGVYTKTGRQKWMFVPTTDEVLYEAPAEFRKGRHHKDPYTPAWHKRLARFMPKSTARIWLQVTNIRVDRLQDITEEDAKAEGVEPGPFGYKNYDTADETEFEFAKDSFESLWVSINGPESWNANPWVWCVSFDVISTTGKPSLITENVTNE